MMIEKFKVTMTAEELQHAPLHAIQAEQCAWSQYNFGEQPAHRPLLGIIEELCEFEEALRKLPFDGPAALEDAIGDVGIYMLDYCGRTGRNIQDVWSTGLLLPHASCASNLIGRLAHAQLKGEQRIRGGAAVHSTAMDVVLAETLLLMQRTADAHLPHGFVHIVRTVWAKVRLRDWRENPNNAHAVAEPTNA